MIGQLQGLLMAKSPPQILLNVGGVGYEVDVPMSSFFKLPGLGEPVTLLTHFVVREDAQLLYGFLSAEERHAFRQLIRISGVGARTALSILSGLSVDDLAQAVAQNQSARLVKVPGIGKKTAERLVLELQGKLSPLAHPLQDGLPTDATQTAGDRHDIRQALLALGYNDKEADQALKTLPSDVGVSEGIRLALKTLNR